MENKKSRKLNFELLRIICMFLIVVFHYHDWGGIINITTPIINKVFGELISLGGDLGVNIFVLISGYFLIDSKFKIKKLLKLLFEVFFYSIMIYVICVCFNIIEFSSQGLKQSLLPISYNMYWFATTYIGMYLMFPIVIKNINKNQYWTILILLGIMLSAIPTIIIDAAPFNSNLIWFIYLYLIAGYIKKYDITFESNKSLIFAIILVAGFMFGTSVFLTKLHQEVRYIIYLNRKNSLAMLALSISVFMLFKNLNIKDNRIIPFFSKATFGVYLIHINAYLREYLFYNILKIQNYYDANLFILMAYVLVTSIAIYIACTLVDTARRKILEEPIFKVKIFDKYFDRIDQLMNFETNYKLLGEKKQESIVK